VATLYTHDFTAANGTKWTAADFDKVLGSVSADALVATISANKGIGPATANEAIYRTAYFAAQRDHKISVSMTWSNAAGTGRAAGPGVRISADGKTGYFAILDSNVGSPRIRLVRRRDNVFTALGAGWVATSEGAAALNAGVTVTLRVQTKDDGVHLKVLVNSSLYFDVVDPSVAGVSIEDAGTGGLYLDNTLQTTDITFDNLTCVDFADEATSGVDWQAGVGLSINGVYYSEAEWRALGLSPEVARASYAPVPVGTIVDLNDPGSPVLRPGDWVQFYYDNVVLAEGLLQTVKQSWPPPGGISYDLVGPRQLAEETLIEDPDTGAPFVSFNFEADSEFYNADRADMTIGDVLKWIYDNLVKGDAGLRAVKAAPASGLCYDASELTGLDAKIPNLTISGNVLQAEETLLTFMPEYAIFVDPTTRVRHVHKRSTAATATLRTGDGHRVADLQKDTSKNYTRIVVFGTTPEAEEQTLLWDPNDPNSSLSPYWDRSLEAAWAPEKAKAVKNEFTIIGYGTEGPGDPLNPNYIYLVVDPGTTLMDEHEWAGTLLVISDGPASGAYTVRDNSAAGKIWLKAWTFLGGGHPDVGNKGFMTGVDDPEFKRNGHDAAFKEFDLGGAQVRGACATALVKNKQGTKTFTVKVKAKKFSISNGDGTVRDGLRLDLPAIGLINRLGTLCNEANAGGAVAADSVEITVPTFDPTTQAIPKIVVPSTGFRGTAYSFDSTRWGGGGEPAAGDPACRRTLALNFPDFQSVALQGSEYTKMADSMLAVLGSLAVSGTISLNEGLDPAWSTLKKRISWVDNGDDGADTKPTGYEGTALWLLQAEFNLRERTTTLFIGTLSSQGVDLDAYRKRYAEKTRLDQLRRMRKLAQDLRECLKNAFNGAGAAGEGGDAPLAGCQVTSDVPGQSMTHRVSSFWEIWIIFLDWFADLLWIQKGIDITNANGSLKSQEELQVLLDNRPTKGFGGVEGGVQATVMANKALLEGLDFSGFVWHGGKCYPSFTASDGSTVYIDPDTNSFFSGFDIGGSPINFGAPTLGALVEGILSNLGKTVTNGHGKKGDIDYVKPGVILLAGTPVPTGGAKHYPGHGSAPVPLAASSIVPPALSTQVESLKKMISGLTPVGPTGSGPGAHVQVPAYQGGSVYAPNTDFGFTKISGPGLAGPSVSGFLGSLASKTAATFDGKANPGSGPGAVVRPGEAVGADGAYYYPPTERSNDPDVHQLAPADVAPASNFTIAEAFQRLQGFKVYLKDDRGGVVYQGPGVEGAYPNYFWRVDPQSATFALRPVTLTPGTGLNGGNWSWGAGASIMRCVRFTYECDAGQLQAYAGRAGVPVAAVNGSGFAGGMTCPLVGGASAVGAQFELPRNPAAYPLDVIVRATIEPAAVAGGNFNVDCLYNAVARGAVNAGVPGFVALAPVVVAAAGAEDASFTLPAAALANTRYVELAIGRPTPGVLPDNAAVGMIVRSIRVEGFWLE